jgi:hypothetical protein
MAVVRFGRPLTPAAMAASVGGVADHGGKQPLSLGVSLAMRLTIKLLSARLRFAR